MREEKGSWRRGSPATVVALAQFGDILAAAGLHDSVRSVELLPEDWATATTGSI